MKKIFKVIFILGWLSFIMIFGCIFYMINQPFESSTQYSELIIKFSYLTSILLVIGAIGGFITERINKSSILKKGKESVGTLVNTRLTGTYINKQPEMELTINHQVGNQVVLAKVKQVILLNEMAMFQPGIILPISYLENNPTKIAIDTKIDLKKLQDNYNQSLIAKGILTEEMLSISKQGAKGSAVVLENRATGRIIDGNSELMLKLMITKINGEQYEASITKIVLPTAISQLQTGCVIDVFYLESNPNKIVIATKVI